MEIKISDTLKQLLAENDLTIVELAKLSKVPKSTLFEWRQNRTPRSPLQVRQVATILGTSMHYLLFGEEDEQEPFQKLLKEEFFSGTFEINIKRVKIKE